MPTNTKLAHKAYSILSDIAEKRHTRVAEEAYSILVEVAENGGTIRYGVLADKVNEKTGEKVQPRGAYSGVADRCLHPISAYCLLNGFPDISCLAVLDDEYPSPKASFNRETVHLTWKAVRAFPWPTVL